MLDKNSAWCMLGLKEWEHFQIVKPRWDNMDVNHLILNVLSQSINKIDATGAITVSTFDTSLAVHPSSLGYSIWHTLLSMLPMWYTTAT
jgi:hypothetical protein